MDVNDFYSELLIEYSQDKSYCAQIEAPDFEEELINPLCGDQVKVSGKITDGQIVEVAYQGKGCAISQASAALLCSLIKGKSLADAKLLCANFENMILGKESDPSQEQLGDAVILSGVSKLPGRQRCALLAWENLKKGAKF